MTVLQAEYRTERACELPGYLGSTLRGALGQELRAVSCVEPDSPCAVCRHPDRCAAGALFDDPPAVSAVSPPRPAEAEGPHGDTGGRAGGFDRPRAYVLVPPPWRRGTYASGETIRLGVTLAGRARVWYPWVVAAMAGIGRRGFGVGRHPWTLVRIGAVGHDGGLIEIDHGTAGVATVVPELEATRIVADGPPPAPRAVVVLVTAADLRQKGRRLDRLDGPTFFRRLIRRIGTMVETYGNPPADVRGFDYHALGSMADQVVVEDQHVFLQTWERYSNRREGKHPLTGLVGRALLTGIPEPLWPYLVLGQWVHLGKGASFGQGCYVVLSQCDSEAVRSRR